MTEKHIDIEDEKTDKIYEILIGMSENDDDDKDIEKKGLRNNTLLTLILDEKISQNFRQVFENEIDEIHDYRYDSVRSMNEDNWKGIDIFIDWLTKDKRRFLLDPTK